MAEKTGHIPDRLIEEMADVAFAGASKDFPIQHEYDYTQGYVNGGMAVRNMLSDDNAAQTALDFAEWMDARRKSHLKFRLAKPTPELFNEFQKQRAMLLAAQCKNGDKPFYMSSRSGNQPDHSGFGHNEYVQPQTQTMKDYEFSIMRRSDDENQQTWAST